MTEQPLSPFQPHARGRRSSQTVWSMVPQELLLLHIPLLWSCAQSGTSDSKSQNTTGRWRCGWRLVQSSVAVLVSSLSRGALS